MILPDLLYTQNNLKTFESKVSVQTEQKKLILTRSNRELTSCESHALMHDTTVLIQWNNSMAMDSMIAQYLLKELKDRPSLGELIEFVQVKETIWHWDHLQWLQFNSSLKRSIMKFKLWTFMLWNAWSRCYYGSSQLEGLLTVPVISE